MAKKTDLSNPNDPFPVSWALFLFACVADPAKCRLKENVCICTKLRIEAVYLANDDDTLWYFFHFLFKRNLLFRNSHSDSQSK